MFDSLCRCLSPGGLISIMALNAQTLALRPALERRWNDALTAFDASGDRRAGRGDPSRHS